MGHDDAENEHCFVAALTSRLQIGFGGCTVRTVGGRQDEVIGKAEVRKRRPSVLPNFRQLYS